MLSWDFTKLSTVKYETNSYEIIEEFRDIRINTREAAVELVPSDDSKVIIVCEEQTNAKHSVGVKKGSLGIEIVNSKKWYEYIGINFKIPKITVYLPKGEYGILDIKSSTGYVNIPADFSFDGIDVLLSTGKAECYASSKTVKIKTSTGDIITEGICSGAVELVTTTGRVNVSELECDGDVKIKAIRVY